MTVDPTTTDRRLGGPTPAARTVKDTRGYRAFSVVNAIVLVLVMIVTLYPFVNILAQSFSGEVPLRSLVDAATILRASNAASGRDTRGTARDRIGDIIGGWPF